MTLNKIVEHIEKHGKEWQKPIAYQIRECILDFVPRVEESIKWGLPFYQVGKHNLCYIHIRKENIRVGFYKGVKFRTQELLEGDGTQVRHHVYRQKDHFDEAVLKVLLEEGLEWLEFRIPYTRKK